jgi:ribosomal protein L40E
MDFLEGLFDIGDNKRRKKGGFFQNDDHHDDYKYDNDHDHRQPYPVNSYPQVPVNPEVVPTDILCRKCSAQTIQGAKFCHECGTAIELILNCASCGSKLPANAPFCPQCGYKNG